RIGWAGQVVRARAARDAVPGGRGLALAGPDTVDIQWRWWQAVVARSGPAGVSSLLAVLLRLTQAGGDPFLLAWLGDPRKLVQEIGQDLVALPLEAVLSVDQAGEQRPLGHRELGCRADQPALNNLHDAADG